MIDKIRELYERITGSWQSDLKQGVDEEQLPFIRKEKVTVFLISFILAVCLWFMVNLSRDFNLEVNLPIELGNIPESEALVNTLPDNVTVNLKGEGWKLISIYNNPPRIFINVKESEVNIYDQVRQQLATKPRISVLKVEPYVLELKLEDRIEKKVPVRSQVSVDFKDQFNYLGEPELSPDSVVINGGRTKVESVRHVFTKTVEFQNVDENIKEEIPLQKPNKLIDLSRETVTFHANVTEFTEGEARVFVNTRNQPDNTEITFSPTSVTIRYLVPIQEYKTTNKSKPFEAYVNYEQILNDSSGYVTPRVETTNKKLHIRIQSFQPRKIAYYRVLSSN